MESSTKLGPEGADEVADVVSVATPLILAAQIHRQFPAAWQTQVLDKAGNHQWDGGLFALGLQSA
jgi:hypothetical protein